MKGLLTKALKILIVPLLFLALYPVQRGLVGKWQDKFGSEIVYLPRGEFVRRVRFGWNDVMADFLWIKGFHYIQGQWQLLEAGYEKPKEGWHRQLPALYDVVTDLDPHFIPAYRGGSVLIRALSRKPRLAVELLEKGVRENPREYWELPYELAVVFVVDLRGDPEAEDKAREWLKVAADRERYPNASPSVAKLAAYLFTKEEDRPDRFEMAIEIWKPWLDSDSDVMKRVAAENICKIKQQKIIYELTKAAIQFETVRGRWPSDLTELVKDQLIKDIPPDPRGGEFYSDPDKRRIRARYPAGQDAGAGEGPESRPQ